MEEIRRVEFEDMSQLLEIRMKYQKEKFNNRNKILS